MHRTTRYCATALALVAFTAPALAQSQQPSADPSKPQTQMQDRAAPADSDKMDQTQSPTTAAPATGSGSVFMSEQSPDELTTDNLIGMAVVNSEGEEIGDITDLVFAGDRIVAAVVGVGGFLGIGAKSVGIAWTSVDVQKLNGQQVALLDLTRQQLDEAPEFKRFEPEPPPPPAGGTGTTPSPTGTGTN